MDKKTDVRDPDEKVVEIEMERLRAFPNHPFKVIGDSQMIELQDSIKKYGVLNPLIVRPKIEGYYEIISGHRRKYAAEKLGYKKIPVIIRMLQDDEAVVIMVDSNLQREQITPSEKAYAYKMKYDAIKKKAGRKNCSQVDHNTGKRSIDVIGELCGDSAKQVQRYIKITELIPALLDKVDDGTMGFTPAVQLSYLKKKEQQEIMNAIDSTQCTPSLSQAIRMKKLSESGKLTEAEIEGILGEVKQKETDRVIFKNEQLYRFFPSTYTSEQMRREILEILKSWRNSNWIYGQEEQNMCKVIAVSNQKGGVGKTVSCVNLGIGLAQEGKKVLLIDADPQGSLTISLGYEEPDEMEYSLATLMLNIVNDEKLNMEKTILHHKEGVDLIPANIELSAIEVSLVNEMSRELIMRSLVERLREFYDFIIIDCMPSLGMMTINALACADSVLIPVQAAYLPVKGLQQLIKTIGRVKKQLNPKLRIEGILLTMVDNRTNYARDISLMVYDTYSASIKVFATGIPMSVRASEVSVEGGSIYSYDPKGKAAFAYMALTKEVLKEAE